MFFGPHTLDIAGLGTPHGLNERRTGQTVRTALSLAANQLACRHVLFNSGIHFIKRCLAPGLPKSLHDLWNGKPVLDLSSQQTRRSDKQPAWCNPVVHN